MRNGAPNPKPLNHTIGTYSGPYKAQVLRCKSVAVVSGFEAALELVGSISPGFRVWGVGFGV